MHTYWAFGLTIQSEIEFPEMHPFVLMGDADVRLMVHGPSTEAYEFPVHERLNESQGVGRYVLNVKDVAAYVVEFGNQINIHLYADADPGSVRLYCLSNAFAALLYQRGKIPLHASGIKIPSGTALIMGDSGAGKSSLLLKLGAMGWNIFTDDVCIPVQSGIGKDLLVHSSYPMVKCWPDTLEKMKLDSTSAHRLRLGSDKLGFYFKGQFDSRPLKPQFVFLIEKSNAVDRLVVRNLSGKELFSRISMQIYRNEHLNSVDRKAVMFDVLTQLAKQTIAYAIERPASQDSLEAMALAVSQKIKV